MLKTISHDVNDEYKCCLIKKFEEISECMCFGRKKKKNDMLNKVSFFWGICSLNTQVEGAFSPKIMKIH